MKFLKTTVSLVVLCITLASPLTARGDSYERINRRYAQENFRAYRNVMRLTYPSPFAVHFGQPFAQRFWGFVDSRVLQPQGPADQLIQDLLRRAVARADVAPDPAAVARSQALDAKLAKTLQDTEDLRAAFGIERSDASQAPSPGGTGEDWSHFSEVVN